MWLVRGAEALCVHGARCNPWMLRLLSSDGLAILDSSSKFVCSQQHIRATTLHAAAPTVEARPGADVQRTEWGPATAGAVPGQRRGKKSGKGPRQRLLCGPSPAGGITVPSRGAEGQCSGAHTGRRGRTLHTTTAVRHSLAPRDSAAASAAMVMRCTSTQTMLHLCSSRQGGAALLCQAPRGAPPPPLPTTSPGPLGRIRRLHTPGWGGTPSAKRPKRPRPPVAGETRAFKRGRVFPPAKRACVRLCDAAGHGRAGTEDT